VVEDEHPDDANARAGESHLGDIQKFSEPFGTKISIENGVGVIRAPREATVPIGGNLRSTFPPVTGRGGRGN
jgi:hypothetical protein